MSEVLVTNDRAMPVPVVMAGPPRWELSGEISIQAGETSGAAEFTIPGNTLFVVTFVSVEGRYSGVVGGEPAAMKLFIIDSSAGTTFKGGAVYLPVRRVERKRSAVCEVLDFVIEGGKKPSSVIVHLDKAVHEDSSPDHYSVRYVLQGHLQTHLVLSPDLGPVPPLM